MKRVNPAVVGAFVVGAIVLAVAAVALFGSGRMFRKTYPYIIYFTGDVNGLNEGAPVKFKGVQVGSVTRILLNVSEMRRIGAPSAEPVKAEDVRIPVIIELDGAAMTEKGGKLAPTPESIKVLVDLGMRAQLAMESFVTGLLYVKLDIFPGSSVRLVSDPTVKYAEIPSLPTPLEEAQTKAAKFLAKLDQLDVEGLVDSLSSTVKGIDRLVNSPGLSETLEGLPKSEEKLRLALQQLRTTLESVQKVTDRLGTEIAPLSGQLQTTAKDASAALQAAQVTMVQAGTVVGAESPMIYQLNETLVDLSAAAAAIRRFAEEMERNPSILVRGKAAPQEER